MHIVTFTENDSRPNYIQHNLEKSFKARVEVRNSFIHAYRRCESYLNQLIDTLGRIVFGWN